MALRFFSLIFFLFCSNSWAELIHFLPGQHKNVSFNQYSGYIVTDARHGRALFYYFVEADSNTDELKPLTLWLNGGSKKNYFPYLSSWTLLLFYFVIKPKAILYIIMTHENFSFLQYFFLVQWLLNDMLLQMDKVNICYWLF